MSDICMNVAVFVMFLASEVSQLLSKPDWRPRTLWGTRTGTYRTICSDLFWELACVGVVSQYELLDIEVHG
jgi:hypothetical protein